MFMHRLFFFSALAALILCAASVDVQAQKNNVDEVFSDIETDPYVDDEEPNTDGALEISDSQEDELLPPGLPLIEGQNVPSGPSRNAADATEVIVSDESLGTETIQQRYENGKVKIRRQVTQDKDENYVNHGTWTWFDENGDTIADCSYQFGRRHGPAMRLYRPDEAKLFQTAPFNQFTGPYKSTANFESGLLNGDWVITDTNGRKISQWSFVAGRRHGTSTWWYSNQQVFREINYSDGELHGDLIEYSATGEVLTKVEYISGRRLEEFTQKDKDGNKSVQGMVLRARLSLKERDEWWKAELAKYTKEGKDEKHGRWIAWYPNGQKKLEGEYQFDLPSGEFSWWHENGQKSIQAFYAAGKKEGFWIWWHENGQKSIQGNYAIDSPAGRWTWWKETGQVDKRIDFSTTGTQLISQPQQQVFRAGRTNSVNSLLQPH